MRELRGSIDVVSFQGWAPASALGHVWVDAPFRPAPSTGLLREGTPISVRIDASGARVVAARIEPPRAGAPPHFAWGVESLAALPPYQRVRFVRPDIEVIGDVAASDFKPSGKGDGEWLRGGGDSYEGGGFMFHLHRGVLVDGAPLAAPGSDIKVGVAKKGAVAYYERVRAPTIDVNIPFEPIGFLHMTVRTSDLVPETSP